MGTSEVPTELARDRDEAERASPSRSPRLVLDDDKDGLSPARGCLLGLVIASALWAAIARWGLPG